MNFFKEDKRIVLKDRRNYGAIFAMLFIVGGVIALFSARVWLPDSVPIMNKNNDTTLNFSRKSATIPTDFYYDETTNVAQITVQKKTRIDELTDFDYKVFLGGTETELPIIVSKGVCIKVDDTSQECVQNVLLQFGIPKNFEYVDLRIIDAENKTETVQLDYRNFIEQSLSDKEENYQKNMDTFNMQIVQLENQKKPLETEKRGYISTSEQLKQEMEALKNEILMLKDDNKINEKQNVLSSKTQNLADMETKIADVNNKINDITTQITDLETQKKAVE